MRRHAGQNRMVSTVSSTGVPRSQANVADSHRRKGRRSAWARRERRNEGCPVRCGVTRRNPSSNEKGASEGRPNEHSRSRPVGEFSHKKRCTNDHRDSPWRMAIRGHANSPPHDARALWVMAYPQRHQRNGLHVGREACARYCLDQCAPRKLDGNGIAAVFPE